MSVYFHDASSQIEFLLTQLQPTNTQQGLDIGYGSGVHLQGLRERGYVVDGIDTEKSELPHTLVADIFAAHLEPDKYDYVYCLSPYFGEKWWDMDVFFTQVAKTLKMGGKFVLDLNNFRSIPENTTIFKWGQKPEQVMVNYIQRLPDRFSGTRLLVKPDLEVEEIPLLWRIFTEKEIQAIANKHGFEITQVFGGFAGEEVNWAPNKEKSRIILLMEKVESASKNSTNQD